MESNRSLSDNVDQLSPNLPPPMMTSSINPSPHPDKYCRKGKKIKLRVGITDDERCEYHVQTPEHQESPDRTKAIRQKLKDTGIYKHLVKIDPIDPTREDLLLVHSNRYINKVMRTCNNYSHAMIGSQDVRVSGKDSLISAGVAVGCVLSAVDVVITSYGVKKVFCNVRPPGHHASAHQASGFCIFNNVAIGAKKALTYPGIEKVLIFDWDLHHGDGTQKIFKCNKDVMYASFHKAPPFYPNSGSSNEKGKFETIHNYPQGEYDTAESYMTEFYQDFLPKARDFDPDIVFISCGFDSHKDDWYEALGLDYNHFKIMTKELCNLANQHSNGKLVSVLEGGYTLSVIAKCAAIHVAELINNK